MHLILWFVGDRCRYALFLMWALLLGGCATIQNSGGIPVSLISDKENTLFRVSVLGVNDWATYGPGKVVTVSLDPRLKYELTAQAPGYIEKTHVLSEVIREVSFTFLIEDAIHPTTSSSASFGSVGSQISRPSIASCKVVNYQYDSKTHKGTIAVDVTGYGLDARDWVIKNIGKICSSKELLNEAGEEKSTGGKYRVLNESIKDNILTVEFSAGYGGN